MSTMEWIFTITIAVVVALLLLATIFPRSYSGRRVDGTSGGESGADFGGGDSDGDGGGGAGDGGGGDGGGGGD